MLTTVKKFNNKSIDFGKFYEPCTIIPLVLIEAFNMFTSRCLAEATFDTQTLLMRISNNIRETKPSRTSRWIDGPSFNHRKFSWRVTNFLWCLQFWRDPSNEKRIQQFWKGRFCNVLFIIWLTYIYQIE